MRKVIYFMIPFLVFIFPMLGHTNGPTNASFLILNIPDPAGDQCGLGETHLVPDLVNMILTFDSSTGEYTIKLSATEVYPFKGQFRININLFNITQDLLFSDTMRDFNLAEPKTGITLTGTNQVLTSWKAGDQVYANNFDTDGEPQPPGITYFRTTVLLLPVDPKDQPCVTGGGDQFIQCVVTYTHEDHLNLVSLLPTTIVIDEKPLGALPVGQCTNLVEIVKPGPPPVTEKFSMAVRNDFDGCIIEASVIFYKGFDCTGDPIQPSWEAPDPNVVYKSGTRGGCAEAVEVTSSSPACVELTLKSGRKTTVCY